MQGAPDLAAVGGEGQHVRQGTDRNLFEIMAVGIEENDFAGILLDVRFNGHDAQGAEMATAILEGLRDPITGLLRSTAQAGDGTGQVGRSGGRHPDLTPGEGSQNHRDDMIRRFQVGRRVRLAATRPQRWSPPQRVRR